MRGRQTWFSWWFSKFFLRTLLFFYGLFRLAYGDMNSQCSICFAEVSFSSYCLQHLDLASGLCCLTSSDGNCLQEQYMCTSEVELRETMHKYAFCAYDGYKCGNLQRTLIAFSNEQQVYTSLEFGIDDTCSYIITSQAHL